jgi:hypothetical protein
MKLDAPIKIVCYLHQLNRKALVKRSTFCLENIFGCILFKRNAIKSRKVNKVTVKADFQLILITF